MKDAFVLLYSLPIRKHDDYVQVKWAIYYLLQMKTNLTKWCIDGLVQERRNSIANALVFRLSHTNPSACGCKYPLQNVQIYIYIKNSTTDFLLVETVF